MNLACYRDAEQSYSWDSFRYIIMTMVNIQESDDQFLSALRRLYQAEVMKFSKEHIDATMYPTAVQQYSIRRQQNTDIE